MSQEPKKRKSLKRRISTTLFYLVVLCFLLFGLFVWLTDTNSGTKTLVRLAGPYLQTKGVELKPSQIKGTVYDATITNFKIHGIELTNTRYDIAPLDLLRAHVNIQQFRTTAHLGKTQLKVSLSGTLSRQAPNKINLSGVWQLDDASPIAHGKASVQGTFKHYNVLLYASTIKPHQRASLFLKAIGNEESLHSTQFTVDALKNDAEGKLNIRFNPFQYDVRLANKTLILSSKGNKAFQRFDIDFDQSAYQTSIHASHDNNGMILINPIKLETPYGPWYVPKTQLKVLGKTIQLPKTCISHNNAQLCAKLDTTAKQITGFISTNTPSLAAFSNITDQVENLSGKLTGQMTFNGDWNKLHYNGHIDLTNGQISLPDYGTTAEQIELHLSSDNKPNISIKGHAKLGEGKLSVSGIMAWADNQIITVISTTGKNATVVNLPFAEVSVSPSLVFTQNKHTRSLTGVVTINKARIDADQFNKQNTKLNSDIVFVNNQNKIIHQKKTLPFPIDVYLDAGKNTLFKGFGITTYVSGKVNIFSSAGQTTLANGRLDLSNGSYSAYGKHFTITKGQLIYFKNPITDPSLNVYATYDLTAVSASAGSINNITVGVHVTGSVNRIKLTMFSDPAMTQENILSYIITGGPLSSVGPSGQSALSQAAVSFAASGGNQSVLDKIRDSLSLNSLRIGSLSNSPTNDLQSDRNSSDPEQNNTAVFIGKALSSRFYISYGVGLFNQQQIFQTHYKISDHWSIKTDNSTLDSGADVIYTFEH